METPPLGGSLGVFCSSSRWRRADFEQPERRWLSGNADESCFLRELRFEKGQMSQ